MSSLGQMELKVKADISDLQTQLNKAGTTTANFSNKVNSSFNKVAVGSNSASVALSNLGAAAQSAPAGLSGITSVVGPLTESFVRLKTESGSTKTALRSLATGLGGAGGIGLAITAASAAMFYFTKKNNEAKEAADKAKEAIKEQAISFKSLFSAIAQERVQVSSLIGILDSEVETRQRKNIALKDLQKINPEIFGQLRIENNEVKGLSESYERYVKTLENVLRVKVLQRKAEFEIEKILEAEEKKEKTFLQSRITLAKEAAIAGKLGIKNTQINTKELREQQGLENALTNEIISRNIALEGLFRLIAERSNLIELSKLKNSAEGSLKNIGSISDVIAELGREIDFLNAKGLIFSTNETEAKIKAIQGTIEKLVKDFNVAPGDTIIGKLTGINQTDFFQSAGLEGITRNIEDLKRNVAQKLKETSLGTPPIVVPINVELQPEPIDQKKLGRH